MFSVRCFTLFVVSISLLACGDEVEKQEHPVLPAEELSPRFINLEEMVELRAGEVIQFVINEERYTLTFHRSIIADTDFPKASLQIVFPDKRFVGTVWDSYFGWRSLDKGISHFERWGFPFFPEHNFPQPNYLAEAFEKEGVAAITISAISGENTPDITKDDTVILAVYASHQDAIAAQGE